MQQAGVQQTQPQPWAQITADAVVAFVLVMIGEMSGFVTGTGFVRSNPTVWLAFVLLMATAITIRSLAPLLALTLLAGGVLIQILLGLDATPLDVAIPLLIYTCAAHPSVLPNSLAWVAAFTAVPFAALHIMLHGSWMVTAGTSLWTQPGLALLFIMFLVLCAIFITPALIGSLVRVQRRSALEREARRDAEQQTVRARQLAQDTVSREQIARDVHDMVGHSLTVIIAQAESMAFLEPDDPRYTQAGAHIATTAREALTEVRRIVDVAMQGESEDECGSAGGATRSLLLADAPDLIARLRDTGWQVLETSDGTPQAIAPDVSAAGAAALREVVTNVLKHGDRQQPVQIAWVWADVLRLSVENAVRVPDVANSPASAGPAARVGRGLIGTRERLAEANGTFAAHPIADNHYRATICVPLALGQQVAR